MPRLVPQAAELGHDRHSSNSAAVPERSQGVEDCTGDDICAPLAAEECACTIQSRQVYGNGDDGVPQNLLALDVVQRGSTRLSANSQIALDNMAEVRAP